MRRSLLCAFAAVILLLQACGGISYTYKENPAAAAGGMSAITATPAVSSGKAQISGDEPSAGVLSKEATPQVSQGETAADTADITPAADGGQEGNGVTDLNTGSPQGSGSAGNSAGSATPNTGLVQEPKVSDNNTGEQPPLLTRAMREAGVSFEDISFSQMVLVVAEGSKADFYCYDKGSDGLWKINRDISYIKGYVGKNGVSFDKREGDNCTPGGLYSLGYAFGNSAKPKTGMEYKSVTAESYWVDDPKSLYYNQWVEGKIDSAWNSAEHLSDSKEFYAYGVVVDYNMAPNTVAGKGSAIFLHCKNEPTTGCVAVPRDQLLAILKWLSDDKNPGILIVGQ